LTQLYRYHDSSANIRASPFARGGIELLPNMKFFFGHFIALPIGSSFWQYPDPLLLTILLQFLLARFAIKPILMKD
jgi:hypothetical protein